MELLLLSRYRTFLSFQKVPLDSFLVKPTPTLLPLQSLMGFCPFYNFLQTNQSISPFHVWLLLLSIIALPLLHFILWMHHNSHYFSIIEISHKIVNYSSTNEHSHCFWYFLMTISDVSINSLHSCFYVFVVVSPQTVAPPNKILLF